MEKFNTKLPYNIGLSIKENNLLINGPHGWYFFKLNRIFYIQKREKNLFIFYTLQHLNGFFSSLKNIIRGISRGYKRSIELVGVGYKGWTENNILFLNIGFSHVISFKIPLSIKIDILKGRFITIKGSNLQFLTQTLEKIRLFKKPDIYKGKGVRFKNEKINFKSGKKKK